MNPSVSLHLHSGLSEAAFDHIQDRGEKPKGRLTEMKSRVNPLSNNINIQILLLC